MTLVYVRGEEVWPAGAREPLTDESCTKGGGASSRATNERGPSAGLVLPRALGSRCPRLGRQCWADVLGPWTVGFRGTALPAAAVLNVRAREAAPGAREADWGGLKKRVCLKGRDTCCATLLYPSAPLCPGLAATGWPHT